MDRKMGSNVKYLFSGPLCGATSFDVLIVKIGPGAWLWGDGRPKKYWLAKSLCAHFRMRGGKRKMRDWIVMIFFKFCTEVEVPDIIIRLIFFAGKRLINWWWVSLRACIDFTGRETFVCTFEHDEHCLLTSNYTSNREIWTIDDGIEIVKDNTLRSGI